ncbi:metal-binding protein [Halobacteriales archaeon QS_9_68_17]|nr:MAG: metal-binding protein [Halobacteriales archaeon QS_9_68_17]
MRKNELVHLHSLLRLLRERYADDGAFAEYDALSINPTHAHRSKGAHKDAVLSLSAQLADELSKHGKYSGRDEAAETPAADGQGA